MKTDTPPSPFHPMPLDALRRSGPLGFLASMLAAAGTLAAAGCLQQSSGPTEWSSKPRSATSSSSPSNSSAVADRNADRATGTVAPSAPSGSTAASGGAARGPGAVAPPPALRPPPPIPVAPLAPGGSPRPAALSLLQAASESPSALLRCNAVEAVAPDADASRSVIQRGLVDSNRAVRFVSAMAVGTHRLCDLSLLVEPLLRDESESVRAAAIFALSQCGRRVDPTPLASMILSDDPEVRGNAALVLGEMGNPTALPLLDGCLGRGMALANPARVRIVELQVAEAQVRLGDARAADPVRAALFAPPEQAELVALACQICGRIKDERSVASLRGLVEANGNDARPPEVRLAAIAALAQLGALSTDVLPMVEFLAASDRPEVRAQAAVTLGRLGDPRGLATAARLMADHDPFVQVAAAGAVTALTGPGRATGVSG